MKTSLLAVAVFVCLLSTCFAQATPKESLLILSKSEQKVSIIDPATLKVVATAPVGPDPHEIIASSDGKLAYVSNYLSAQGYAMAVIDLIAQKPLPSVELQGLKGPHGLHYAGGKVWFTIEGSKAAASYNPSTGKIDWVMGTGQNATHMIYVFDDLKRVITSNISSATMSFLIKTMSQAPPGAPARENWEQYLVNVGGRTEGFDVSPDGREVWGASATDGTVAIIEVATRKLTETIQTNTKSANRLKFTPDGKLVFISSLTLPDVVVIDAATRKEVKRIPVGRGAAGIQMQPDGKRVFVACTPDNYVAVIDTDTMTVTGHIDAGRQPDGMAWATRK